MLNICISRIRLVEARIWHNAMPRCECDGFVQMPSKGWVPNGKMLVVADKNVEMTDPWNISGMQV